LLNGWLCAFFVPGLVLSLLIGNSIGEEWAAVLVVVFAIWMASTAILSLAVVGASWVALNILIARRPPRCAACRRVTRQANPAVAMCEHCGRRLAEWLFVPERGTNGELSPATALATAAGAIP
jgi:hypothetical protein